MIKDKTVTQEKNIWRLIKGDIVVEKSNQNKHLFQWHLIEISSYNLRST